MAKLFIQDTTLTAIADAIRAKTDTPSYEYLDYMECSVSKSNMGMGEYEFAHFTFPGASSIQVVVYNFNKQYTDITSGKGSFKIIEGIEESSAYYGVDLAASQTYNFEGNSFTVYSNGKCSVYVAEFKVYGFDAEGNPLQYVVESEGGEPAKFKPTEMPAAILAISGEGGGGITPSGELAIYDNGSYDVTEYASAVVSVEKGVFPEGDFPITENGQYNITRYNTVTVEVPTGGGTGDDLEYPVLSGTQNYAFHGGSAGEWALETFGNKITTSNLEDTTYMFNMSSLETIPIKLNYIDYYHVNMNYMFNYAQNLTALPEFSYVKPDNMNSTFKQCRKLVDVEALVNFDLSEQNKGSSYNAYELFYMCCSLRSIPVAFLKQLWNLGTNASRSSYGHTFMYCYSLDEISNWGVSTASLSSNMFSYTFDELCCLKKFTFDTNDDGTAKTAKWKNQVIDLSVHVGYDGSSMLQSMYFSGGRAFTTQITDAASYATLKDNSNSWTKLREYSRYNRASAVETINSLPDCSAYIAGSTANNNVIKFTGAAGSATDAGAINTMTDAEIAVAAAKGWTVSFA
jgi:hypothetical protein